MMTLDEFRATGQDYADLRNVIDDDRWEAAAPGRVYLGCLYMERKPESGWPNRRGEEWWMPLNGQEERMSNDLPRLEALLYEFAVAEGYIGEGEL